MSKMNMEEKEQSAEEPLKKKAGIEECQEDCKPNEENLPIEITAEEDENNKVMESSSNLPHHHRRRLPLEMNCEVFKCLKVPIQIKFIWGLGKGIYGMFGHKLLVKTKRFVTPRRNHWMRSVPDATISSDGLKVSRNKARCFASFFARHGFAKSREDCRKEGGNFPGTIVHYFEVTITSKSNSEVIVGLSDLSNIPIDRAIDYRNSYNYHFSTACDPCCFSSEWEEAHDYEWPNGSIIPEWNWQWYFGDVIGCGLLLDPMNELTIFYTLNGILLGKQIPIKHPGDYLYPTVTTLHTHFETNFGEDQMAMPFKYDIKKCSGLN